MMLGVIAVSWFLSLGYVTMQDVTIKGIRETIPSGQIATVADLGLKERFESITVYGSIENYQFIGVGDRLGYFMPYRADYTFGVAVELAEGISLNFAHECDHPVIFITDGSMASSFLSAETKIFIRFEGGEK